MEITIGNLIDQLSIVNIRIWMLEDRRRDESSSDQELLDVNKKISQLNPLRNDLIQAIDEGLNKIAEGKKQKLYGQGSTKMYGKKK
jgi:hypothetical protein